LTLFYDLDHLQATMHSGQQIKPTTIPDHFSQAARRQALDEHEQPDLPRDAGTESEPALPVSFLIRAKPDIIMSVSGSETVSGRRHRFPQSAADGYDGEREQRQADFGGGQTSPFPPPA